MKSKDAFKSVFGEDYKKESYQMKGHTFNGLIAGKSYCMSCGFIALNNEFSRWCIDKGCYADLHPQYQSVKKRLTKLA
mgnify:CR=1 FL=1